MTTNLAAVALGHLGNVPMSYEHEWRVAEPAGTIVVPIAIFKWYHVHREGVPVPAAIDAEARAIIAEAAAGGDWNLEYGLNFALLHQSTAQAFLIAGVWRGHQELWECVYVKELVQPGPFVKFTPEGHDWPNSCVWEMGVIHHERMAWHRYLFSGRTEADKRAWLADTYAGPV